MAQVADKVKLSFKALKEPRVDAKAFSTHELEFEYTPRITQSIEVQYSQFELQHTNYQPSAFGSRKVPTIGISGPFVSRTEEEGRKTLNAIHLLRTATMMYYGRGEKEPRRGTPPPIGRLNAYGLYNNTPVVVASFQYDYPQDVDYISVKMADGVQTVPVLFDITISLLVQFTPIEVVSDFTLGDFASGKLLGKGYI
jgi:hypothetical protein